VVDTPVAPVMAPPPVMAMEGELRRLLIPTDEAKLIPLITLELLFETAGKLIPLSYLCCWDLPHWIMQD